jgi:hypothetical protein
MDQHGYAQCTPRNRDGELPTQPFIDLKAGYVQRSVGEFPRQGLKAPWRLYQNYARDILMLRYGALQDDALQFAAAPAGVRDREEPVAA